MTVCSTAAFALFDSLLLSKNKKIVNVVENVAGL